jgi:tetratricopeptide (TPR) repeat protein
MLTSTHPFSNGIEDNGEVLGPNTVTLASVLKSTGYRTAAFVGSYVLDRRFGLDQGFDFYDSPFDLHRRAGAGGLDSKRPGEQVVHSAKAWIEAQLDGPLFVFLHLYDLHKPYDLPSSFRKRFDKVTGYDAQLRYVDEQLGTFWTFLSGHGLLEKSLIVFTSDHGEGLGDHGESTHGYFIYQSTLRVPLIIHWPSGPRTLGSRVEVAVSLIDLAPTVLQFAGIPRPPRFQGQSLLDLSSREMSPEREVYGETLFAKNHFGCSALRSLRSGRYKYIEAPKPELYDLAKDPGEAKNLYASEKSRAHALRERLYALSFHFPGNRSAKTKARSTEDIAALSSLGYLAPGGPESLSSNSGVDPKDRIEQAETYHYAVALAASGRLADANKLLEQLRAKLPEVTAVLNSLGLNQQKLGKHAEAAVCFREVLKLDPRNAEVHYNLAVSLFALRQTDDGVKELLSSLQIDPSHTRAGYLLGTIWMKQKDYSRARQRFDHMLTIAADDYAAHYHLGILATLEGNWQEAERQLRWALKTDSESAEAYNALGSVYLRQGNRDEAKQAFQEAIRLEPKFAGAHYNLGLLLHQQKKNEQAAEHFRQALSADPQFREARQALNLLERKQN